MHETVPEVAGYRKRGVGVGDGTWGSGGGGWGTEGVLCLAVPRLMDEERRCYKTLISLKTMYDVCVHVCRPTGAVRVSFGWMSSEDDVQAIITFLKTCFQDTAGRQDPSGQNLHGQNLHGQNSQRQNSGSTPAASMKGKPTRQNPIGQNPSPCGHNPGVQDPSFSLNAHCSTAMPSAAESNHPSPVHSTARSMPVNSQGRDPQRHSQQTQSSSSPLQGSNVHNKALIQSAEFQTAHTVSRAHDAQSDTGPRTSAQELTVQQSNRSAWLRQLPWVRCGDKVSAWSAAKLQRLTSPSPTPSGEQSGGQPGGQSEGQPGGQPGGQLGGQFEVLPHDTFVPLYKQPAQSAHSPSESQSALESASQSVLRSDFQHHSESQPFCSQGSLEGIWVYPIKSCGGIRVSEWPLGPNGLLLDREWALVGDDGCVLTQKGLPKLALVQPRVDLWQGFIQVRLASIGPGAT